MIFFYLDFLSSHPVSNKLMYSPKKIKFKLSFLKPLLTEFYKFDGCVFEIQPVRFFKKQFRIRLRNLSTNRVYFDRKFECTPEEVSKFFGAFPTCFSNDLQFLNVYFSVDFLKKDKEIRE